MITVNALAEFERHGIAFTPVGDDEVRVLCPVHEDSTPSVQFNTAKNVWNCKTCKAKGDIVAFLAFFNKVERKHIVADLAERYGSEASDSAISSDVPERYHAAIGSAPPQLLKSLRERGITEAMQRVAKLGFHAGRITIPIFDERGQCQNIRRYLPGAPGAQKFRNSRGRGKARIYRPNDAKSNDVIWICGGELKALVVGEMLDGVGAISLTAGEGQNWQPEWNDLIKGKQIFICMDVDVPGQVAARNLAGQIYRLVKSVHIINLPLDRDRFPKGDVNDYVGSGATADDLRRCMENASPYEPVEGSPVDIDDVLEVTLKDITRPDVVRRRVNFTSLVRAASDQTYLLPHRVNVACSRKEKGCNVCPIYGMDVDDVTAFTRVTVPTTSRSLVAMIGAPDRVQEQLLLTAFGIPKCQSVAFHVVEHIEACDVRFGVQVDLAERNEDTKLVPGVVVGQKFDMNTPYSMLGVVYPHPTSQVATVLVDALEPTSDHLDHFEPDEDELAELEAFRPTEWKVEAIQDKLDEIYEDFADHVTSIYHRPDLHLVTDLTYHSVISFKLDGKPVNGWVNSVIVGDTAQGKTETTTKLMKHYGLGARIECKNATPSGLIGGVQQINGRWFTTWGIIPSNDRRLVILEEVKGMPVDTIGKMTDMRSSGIAELGKIEHGRSLARTRLIFISNPRGDRPLNEHSFGCESIANLIGHPEDVRRFDIALCVASDDIDSDVANQARQIQGECRFKPSACRTLLLFAWTRTTDQVRFEDESAVFSSAKRLISQFSDALPIIDQGSTRLKIARLAIALAARTASIEDECIVVRRCHVEFIEGFLSTIYSTDTFGYARFTDAYRRSTEINDEEGVESAFCAQSYSNSLKNLFISHDQVTVEDVQDFGSMTRDEAMLFISILVRNNCIRRHKRVYHPSSSFKRLLERIELHESHSEF